MRRQKNERAVGSSGNSARFGIELYVNQIILPTVGVKVHGTVSRLIPGR